MIVLYIIISLINVFLHIVRSILVIKARETADMMVSEVDRSSQELIKKYPTEKVYYTEVLNRFNKSKEAKK